MAEFSVQIRRMLNPGVVATARKLADRQDNNWAGAKSIHPNRRSVFHTQRQASA